MISPINQAGKRPSFKSLDTKDKLILSTPILAAASAMYEAGSPSKTSNILFKGGRAFARWTCGLAAGATVIVANRFLARNSKSVRDFEEKHRVWTMLGTGAVAVGLFHGYKSAAKGFAHMKKGFFDEATAFVKKIDDVDVINKLKESYSDVRVTQRLAMQGRPKFFKNMYNGLEKLENVVTKNLPTLALLTACGLAMISPKIMPKD